MQKSRTSMLSMLVFILAVKSIFYFTIEIYININQRKKHTVHGIITLEAINLH